MKFILVVTLLISGSSALGQVWHTPIKESDLKAKWADADLVVSGRVDKIEAVYHGNRHHYYYSVRLVVDRTFKGDEQKTINFLHRGPNPPHPSNKFNIFGDYVVFLQRNEGKDEVYASFYDTLLAAHMRLEGNDPVHFFDAPSSIQAQLRRFIISKITKDRKEKGSNQTQVATP